MNRNRKQVTKISIFITSIFVIFLSVTYAFINMTLVGTKRQVITSGNLDLELLEDENNLKIEDALPMYDEVGMIQEPFTFRLVNKTSYTTDYNIKLENITVDGGILEGDVKYGLTKDGESTIALVSAIEDGVIDSGTIAGNKTIEYELRLWVRDDITDMNRVQNKSLRFKLNVKADQNTVIGEVQNLAFEEDNLGEKCATYDDEIDTFLVGQCNRNYVWYSGKLWRIVLKNNETKNIKMITDNAITSIYYNELYNANFEDSYVDQWLQQEFLPTLHNYEDYLVMNNVWYTEFTRSADYSVILRPTGNAVNRTVGLLNSYEYSVTYAHSNNFATSANNYLNIGVTWFFITNSSPNNISSRYDGVIGASTIGSYSHGIRPSINLKAGIQIISGNGTISNPYKLLGEEQANGTISLNTRYSGEYIKFNDELYRIVGVEDNLTKITAVDKPAELANNVFCGYLAADRTSSFERASIKGNLETYYQGLNDNWKNMIEPNKIWYLGTVGTGTSYKASICASVNANIDTAACSKTTAIATSNIGLPRIGEMFASQITRGVKSTFLTLTPYNSSDQVWYFSNRGNLTDNGNKVGGARPSMYLKENVIISKDNTGNGTYEHPYDIELGV